MVLKNCQGHRIVELTAMEKVYNNRTDYGVSKCLDCNKVIGFKYVPHCCCKISYPLQTNENVKPESRVYM